eukprot:CAMPEP_0168316864 /NCGR_PEP_ID=MMETSP0210-20121227/20016_1 /TAXON_ID=40633 /ORGANISM="Condylostoma magnum, Strain COL2" /LENGTH=100 /DNA_ID=CAMNT_0008306145 /DNA_START=213 /DNA_END=515 /DNA_ORIENTATION=-
MQVRGEIEVEKLQAAKTSALIVDSRAIGLMNANQETGEESAISVAIKGIKGKIVLKADQLLLHEKKKMGNNPGNLIVGLQEDLREDLREGRREDHREGLL